MAKGFRFAEQKYFYVLATSRSMRKAADTLHVSASALSRQMRKIEDMLGAQVIERGRAGIKLTVAGEYLLQHIKESFANEERLLARISEVEGLQRGHVRIACGDGFLPDLMGDPLEGFARQYPGINLEIKLGSRDAIVKNVFEEEAELGLIYYYPPDNRLTLLARSRQPLHVIVSPQHELARKKFVSLRLASAYPMALLVPTHGVRQAIDVEAKKAKVELFARFTCNSITALRSFAERYDVATILPRFCAIPELASGTLVSVPLSGTFFTTTEAVMIAKQSRQLTRPAAELARVLAAGMTALTRR